MGEAGDFKQKVEEFEKLNADNKEDEDDVYRGLGRDEVLKLSQDPFWVRLRFLLLILFWVVWAAMLIGAVVIVMNAPNCDGKKEILVNSPSYRIDRQVASAPEDISEEIKSLDSAGFDNLVFSPLLSPSLDALPFEKFFQDKAEDFEVSDLAEPEEKYKHLNQIYGIDVNGIEATEAEIISLDNYEDLFFVKNCSEGAAISADENWIKIVDNENETCCAYRVDGKFQFNLNSKEVLAYLGNSINHFVKEVGVEGFMLIGVDDLVEVFNSTQNVMEITVQSTNAFLKNLKKMLHNANPSTTLVLEPKNIIYAIGETEKLAFINSLDSENFDLITWPVYSLSLSKEYLNIVKDKKYTWATSPSDNQVVDNEQDHDHLLLLFAVGFARNVPQFSYGDLSDNDAAADNSSDAYVMVKEIVKFREKFAAFANQDESFFKVTESQVIYGFGSASKPSYLVGINFDKQYELRFNDDEGEPLVKLTDYSQVMFLDAASGNITSSKIAIEDESFMIAKQSAVVLKKN